jgi:hypothetical protein
VHLVERSSGFDAARVQRIFHLPQPAIVYSRPAVMAEALKQDGPAHVLLKPLGYEVFTFRRGRLEPGAGGGGNHFLVPGEKIPSGLSLG